jgi:hypothetical protein
VVTSTCRGEAAVALIGVTGRWRVDAFRTPVPGAGLVGAETWWTRSRVAVSVDLALSAPRPSRVGEGPDDGAAAGLGRPAIALGALCNRSGPRAGGG